MTASDPRWQHAQANADRAWRGLEPLSFDDRAGVNGHSSEPPDDGWQAPDAIPDNIEAPREPAIEPSAHVSALIQSSAQFVEGFVPPDYLIDGILQRGFLYSLTGKTGGGKTAIALLIVQSVARGIPIGGYEVCQGRALYFAGENPDDIRMRWIAMAERLGFDINTIDVDFIAGTFKISEMGARIRAEAERRGELALVIIDTSAAYFEGDDENSNAQAGVHARRLRSLIGLPGKPCVIVNCHPTKNAADDNLLPRGGGAFTAEVDGNLTSRRQDGVVELHWQGKFRGPDFAPVNFHLTTIVSERLRDTKGRSIPTVMAAHLSDTAQEEIAAVIRDDENRLLAAIASNTNASIAQLAVLLNWMLKSGGPHKAKVQRTRETLRKDKLVTIERGRAVLTDKGTKALAADTAKAAAAPKQAERIA